MKGKITFRILIISLMMLIACTPTAFCTTTGTIRMKIDNSTPWTNINVSESYEECLSLNSTTSTLGTSALEAHLTTDYDWTIMSIFAVSQYGAKTTNAPSSTTNNKSGIYDFSLGIQTTGLLNKSTNKSTIFVTGLYDESGNPKKYVNKINSSTGEDQNGKICVGFLKNGGTKGWLNSVVTTSTYTGWPVSMKYGLFGVGLGHVNGYYSSSGAGESGVTFRPVIWN